MRAKGERTLFQRVYQFHHLHYTLIIIAEGGIRTRKAFQPSASQTKYVPSTAPQFFLCDRRDSNPYGVLFPLDSESSVSTSFTTIA